MKKIIIFILALTSVCIYADEKAACKAVSEFSNALRSKDYAKAYQYVYNKKGRLSKEEFVRDLKRSERDSKNAIPYLTPISAEVDGNEAELKCKTETVVKVKLKKVKGKWVIADIDL